MRLIPLAKLNQPPWRTVIPAFSFVGLLLLGFLLWSPGLDVRDGRHDRGNNGIWIGHGWFGADEWFRENNKAREIDSFRDVLRVRQLMENCRQHGITDVFPHVCPARGDGSLPPVDDAQVERFLAESAGLRLLPWIGGPSESSARYKERTWRSRFIAQVRELLLRHQRLAGVHLNVEPMPSGDRDFLVLLDELRAALPAGKILSIAAYPPPTRWQPTEEVHWDETYFRNVASRVDQVAVMMYDTGIRVPKVYERLVADWTEEVLQWSEGRPVLLGVPTYEDAQTEYHRPRVENLQNALLGIHAGLTRHSLPPNYQGVAIYSEWETDEREWEMWRQRFLQKTPRER
jgi:hypothetical protein